MNLRIGLTGGIGCGKSTVAAMFAARGALVIDTDAIARALTAPGGAALAPIAAAFGPDMIGTDGALDRARMRGHAFANSTARQRLENILHPLIEAQAQQQANAARVGQSLVYDVPLLVELIERWRPRLDKILVIDCAAATQVERVASRDGWPIDTVQRIIAQQASREQRRAAADAVIVNDGLPLAQLDAEIGRLWRQWQVSAGH